ncbi:MAG: lysophospholipid acyltransferase family protein [Ktedonobacterales bacterium]
MTTLNTSRAANAAAAKPEPRVAEASPLVYGLTRLVVGLISPFIVNLRTEGIENIPKSGPVILAMNHIHWLDIPLASLRVPRVAHYMAKIELFGVPLFGSFIRMDGAFPVRRGEGDREAIRIGERLLAAGEIVVIFPEGHRSGNGMLQQAHPGAGYLATRTGAPVVAVAISGTQMAFKKFRPTVTIRYSQPFVVQQVGDKRTRDSVAQATDQVMYQIAALLPREFRGAYGDIVAMGPPMLPPADQ